MTDMIQDQLLPRFLGKPGQRFYTLQFRAQGQARGHVVYVPPFGEEMNRCRALVAQQARALAAMGYHCTLVDFCGTGDSEGELVESSLQQWHGNLAHAISCLQSEEDLPLTLWGLRLGALLALDFCANSDIPINSLLLWQPLTSGKRFVSQLLRQRVASLVSGGLPPETTTEIRQRLAAGKPVEVSGYTVAEALIAGIEALSIPAALPQLAGPVYWMENVEDSDDGLSTAAGKAVDKLREAGCEVQVALFWGAPVWQLHKRDELPELLSVTSAALG
ncbi:MAG: hydrolase 2, exosortase A system-associated [Halioglobus sp.]